MPKVLRRTIEKKPFRESMFGSVVGLECRGLGKLDNAYREKCYGGDELQFVMRSAKHQYSTFGDGYANAQLKKLGLNGATNPVCSTCFLEKSDVGNCDCD